MCPRRGDVLVIERGRPPRLTGDAKAPIAAAPDEPHTPVRKGDITLDDSDGEAVHIDVPLTTANRLYFRAEPDRLLLSEDPRLLHRAGDALDGRALYSLLQFGAIVPPLTLWPGVRRFTPGRRHALRWSDLSVREVARGGEWPACDPATESTRSDAAQCDAVEALVDAVLRRQCAGADLVILFSGGVDSSLLAARAAAMGWRDTLLLNYAMGAGDQESSHAEAIARHLGLRFERVTDDGADSMAVLHDAATIYPQPIGDHSCMPSYALARAAAGRVAEPSVVLDGTGADGCFGLFGKAAAWRSLYRVPGWVRAAAGAAYGLGSLWRSTSRMEYRLRLARRAAQMPLLAASVAQNPLAGIAYHADAAVRHEVYDLLLSWIERSLPLDDARAQLAGTDLALVCADVFAQKNKPVFDASPHRIAYPFLAQETVSLALTRAVYWPGSALPKRALKAALARHVPPELVYRPKSGFVAPLPRKLAAPSFLSAYDRLLESSSPLSGLMDRRFLRRVRPALAAGAMLPAQTYNFVWAAVFLSCWLDGSARRTPGSTPASIPGRELPHADRTRH